MSSNDNKKGKQKKQSRYLRNRAKYESQYTAFDLKEKSPIRTGMVYDRPTNDMAFGIAFVICFIIWVGIVAYGISNADLQRVFAGVDSDHQVCGTGKALPQKFLFVQQPKLSVLENEFGYVNETDWFDNSVCVTKCPTQGEVTSCKTTTNNADCPTSWFETEQVLFYCIPTPASIAAFKYKDSGNGEATTEATSNLIDTNLKSSYALINAAIALGQSQVKQFHNSTWFIAVSFAITVVLCIAYIFLMSNHTRTLAMVSIILIEIITFAMFGYGFILLGNPDTMPIGVVFIVIFGLQAIIINCALIFYWSKLQVAIAIIGIAADYYAATKRIILVSLFYFIVHVVFFAVYVYTVLGLISMNTFKFTDATSTNNQGQTTRNGFDFVGSNTQRKTFSHVNGSVAILAVSFFIYTWIAFYIHNKVAFVTSVGAATYYFSSDSTKDGEAEIMLGLKWSVTKNFGSLCMGALIMAIINIIRSATEKNQNNQSGAGAAMGCCISCIADIIDFLDELAMAFMAVSGDKFCTSAWNGFMISMKHWVKFWFALDIGRFFTTMGILSITFSSTIIFYGLSQLNNPNGGQYFIGPTVFVFFFNWLICYITLGIFSEAVIASLMCLAIDMDLNNGVPQHGNKKFHDRFEEIMDAKFVDKYNDQMNQNEPLMEQGQQPGYDQPVAPVQVNTSGSDDQQPVYQ